MGRSAPTRRRGPALVVAALLVASACSGDGDDPAPAAGTGSPTTAGGPTLPVVGGTLRLGMARIASLDPADASPESPSAAIAADLLFDGLTVVPEGADHAEPLVAESFESPDGGLTWRFVIRGDARFSNGRAIGAADAEFSIERVARRGAASLAAARLDLVAGFAEFVSGSAADLAGVRTVDDRTLEVALVRPLAALPELLSSPAFGIVPREAVETIAPPFAEAPGAGSGPFAFASREGDVVHLARASQSDAYLAGVDLHFFDDLVAAYDAFVSGRLDWTLVPPSRVDEAAERYGPDGFVPFQAELFFGFNLLSPTFADVRFRQAIVHAVDREAVVNAVYFGVAQPLGGVIPEGVPGHDPDRCGDPCAHDPDRARSLLSEAFPSGGVPEVFIDYDDGADEAAVAGIIESSLEAVGIPATLRPRPPEEYDRFAVSGQQQLFRLGWIGLYPAPDAYLSPLFRSDSSDNVTGFDQGAVDQLLDAASAAADPDERLRLAGEAEAAILAHAAILPLAQFRLLSITADRVHDLVLTVGGTFDGTAVWLDEGG